MNETSEEGEEWEAVTVPEEKEAEDSTTGHVHEHEFTLKDLSKATEYEVSLQVVNSFGSNRPSTFRFATLGSTVSTWKTGGATSVSGYGVHLLAIASIAVAVGSRL